jgi:hypothetical protein
MTILEQFYLWCTGWSSASALHLAIALEPGFSR